VGSVEVLSGGAAQGPVLGGFAEKKRKCTKKRSGKRTLKHTGQMGGGKGKNFGGGGRNGGGSGVQDE